ncbi:pentapeptide repeat-containing protein [Clostridium sediminicola]|uniref:pentapeptide repeat-containing protein n=1 Tax=Clostridium sediminicola TaxID=3114879 RepID=UPI0031F22A38
MVRSKRVNDQINISNRKKTGSDFMYKDLRRSNCYSCNFSNSNFNHTSFRGAQFKSCNFFECTFESTEFVATNLKKSRFKQAKFVNAIFDSSNLEGVDFEEAEFKNVIFVSTDTSKAINLDLSNEEIKIFNKMPKLEISEELESAVKSAMKNEYIKFARILDTKKGGINPISMMILLENFDEKTLIKGFDILKSKVNKNFGTLSYIIQELKTYQADGVI